MSAGSRHRATTGPGRSPAGRVLVFAAAALMTAAVAGLAATPSAAGADVTASTEVITQPGQLAPLQSGGSATPYGVVLPANASCPGDTAHQAYHVFSYLVPKGVSPAAVSFKDGIPSRYFGFISYGSYYGAINTAEGTGQVVGIPASFTWTRLTPKDLFPDGQKTATWDGGIACADTHGVVTNYWNSEIVFTASATDPGGFTWRVVHSAATSSGDIWLGIGVALIAMAVIFGLLALLLSRRNRSEGPQWPNRPAPGMPAPAAPGAPGDRPTVHEVQHAGH
jgi:hypothetical protein